MVKYNLEDVAVEVSFCDFINHNPVEREIVAIIKDDEVKFLDHEELNKFIFELWNRENDFISAYKEDNKIMCQFVDEKFTIDLI